MQTHLGLCGAACSGCFLTVSRMLALDLQAARADGGLNGPAGTGMEQGLTRTGIRFLHRGSGARSPLLMTVQDGLHQRATSCGRLLRLPWCGARIKSHAMPGFASTASSPADSRSPVSKIRLLWHSTSKTRLLALSTLPWLVDSMPIRVGCSTRKCRLNASRV